MRAVLSRCRPADSLAATTTDVVGKLLVPATQHGAGCSVQVVRSGRKPGSLEPDARVQDALRTPSPLLRISVARCGGGARLRLWAAHPREAMEERVPSAARGLITAGSTYFYITPRGYPEAPRLAPIPMLSSLPV